jgi:hypothetical protein
MTEMSRRTVLGSVGGGAALSLLLTVTAPGDVSEIVFADGNLKLRLVNNGSEAAHLAIYPYGAELSHPAHRDVLSSWQRPLP